jgi:DNA topoisomerase-1
MGMIVTDFLVEHFPDIMNYQFTAQVEEQFDTIATGNLKRQDMITTFYGPFHKQIEEVTEHAERASGERVL